MTTGALATSEDKTTRVNVNLERMPLAFLGENSERIRIQKEHVGTGKRIVLFQEKEGENSRSLSMSPSSTYGLLTGFDIDVLTVIQYKLYQTTKIEGSCPLKARLWLSEFPSIMKLQKSGGLYRRIRESIIKISETVLYHEKSLFIKDDRHSTKRLMKDDAIRIILYIRSEEEVKSGTVEFNKSFIKFVFTSRNLLSSKISRKIFPLKISHLIRPDVVQSHIGDYQRVGIQDGRVHSVHNKRLESYENYL